MALDAYELLTLPPEELRRRLAQAQANAGQDRAAGIAGGMLRGPTAARLSRAIYGEGDSQADLANRIGVARYGADREDKQNAAEADWRHQQYGDTLAQRQFQNNMAMEGLDLRRQAQADSAAARADAASARGEAAEERRQRNLYAGADKTRREYDKKASAIRSSGSQAEQILQLASNPELINTPQGQTALVFSFGRMLDPTSVVREGEYKLFEQGRGLLDTLGNFSERVQSGARLTPQQIKNMASIAAEIRKSQDSKLNDVGGYYHKLSTERGYDPYEVVGDWKPMPVQPSGRAAQPQAGGQPSAVYDASGRRVR